MNRWPDFIVMGAMKSATSTLHEQLNEQHGFFMSEEKEPNFFSNDEIYAKGLDWYASLFANALPGDLCGESSTHYTKLPTYPHTVARMKAVLPQLKLIYMMRHPIDRLISHYLHEQFEWRMQMPIEEAIDKHPELISYGCYSLQLEPFLDAYGAENILLIFFERFVVKGQEELERVCRFVGSATTAAVGRRAWRPTNVSSQRMRESHLRDTIVNAPVLQDDPQATGPEVLARPGEATLADQATATTFQLDGATPRGGYSMQTSQGWGSWLNIELSCRSFHEVARSSSLHGLSHRSRWPKT